MRKFMINEVAVKPLLRKLKKMEEEWKFEGDPAFKPLIDKLANDIQTLQYLAEDITNCLEEVDE